MIRIVHNAEQKNQVDGQWPKPPNRNIPCSDRRGESDRDDARNFTFGVFLIVAQLMLPVDVR
jgi:hypothetical protein